MRLHVELERMGDGRWVGEVPNVPGVTACGRSRAEAIAVAELLALRTLVARWTRGEGDGR